MDEIYNDGSPVYGRDEKLWNRIWSFKQMRETYEPMFYLARLAYEGKHFTYWNRAVQRISEVPLKKTTFMQIPELSKQVEAYENFLLSTDLSFFVSPKRLSDDKAVKDSMFLSLLARDYYRKLKDNTTFADYIHSSMLDNVSFLEVAPNSNLTDVEYRAYDGFDILFNPKIKDWSQQRLVVKVVRINKDRLINSKLYHVGKDYVPEQNGGVYLTWKDIWEQDKYNAFVKIDLDETVIFECNILEQDENGQDYLRIKTLDLRKNVLRDDKYMNIHGIPIIPLRIFSGEWYQPSYAYRLIPINRLQDIIANRIDDMFLRITKGGWVKQEEENIDGGMNEEVGQLINYSTHKPEPITMPTIPGFFGEWFNQLLGLSERYGISSILSGSLPAKASGIRAAKMIDQIKGLTLTNNTATINSLRASVKSILEYTFAYLYEMWQTPHEVIYSDMDDLAPQFVSAKTHQLYTNENNKGKLIAIPAEYKRFDVDIDNGLGYTLEKRQENAIELFKLQVINAETLKKIFKLGATGYLLENEEPKMTDTADFQAMIADFPNKTPDEQAAIIKTLQSIGSQVGNQPTNPEDMAKLPLPGGGAPSNKPPVLTPALTTPQSSKIPPTIPPPLVNTGGVENNAVR